MYASPQCFIVGGQYSVVHFHAFKRVYVASYVIIMKLHGLLLHTIIILLHTMAQSQFLSLGCTPTFGVPFIG